MPELPEVETVVRDLRELGLVGATITGVGVFWERTVAFPSAARFREGLRHVRVTGITRRAKYIVMDLSSSNVLIVHLRMTGQFHFEQAGRVRDAHDHIVLRFSDGRQLHFRDTRKFGRWWLTDDPSAVLGSLGPEPLDKAFTLRLFQQRLAGRSRMLKPLLLDQSFIAGLGNIYVDEALFAAGLHPERASDSLGENEQRDLYRAIRSVLGRGVRALGTSLGATSTNFYSVAGRRGRNQDALKVFRRTGMPCPRCGTPIVRLVVAQRSTHVCEACQPSSAPSHS